MVVNRLAGEMALVEPAQPRSASVVIDPNRRRTASGPSLAEEQRQNAAIHYRAVLAI